MLDDAETLVGREFGPYRIVRELGRGGMGVVYEAQDRRLRRAVALKALTAEYTHDPVLRERLTREARAAASLSHPGIATVFALEEIDGHLFIVSELVRGRTLREEIDEGPVPRRRLLSTLIEIASALAAAHQQGIVHRDLKPGNIIRDTDGRAKVLDFGIATVAEALTSTSVRLTVEGTVLGTPGYMAPEQLRGATVDGRSDIFAFGVVMWELATGEHPFGSGPAELLERMTDLMSGRLSAVSRTLPMPDLDAIARRCLRTAADERYQSAAELLEDLRSLSAPAQTVAASAAKGLWWWQFHQVAIAVLHAMMPPVVWLTRSTVHPTWRSRLLFATLIAATTSVTLRLNLWFISRVQQDHLNDHRRRILPVIVVSEVALVMVLLTAAILVGATSDELAVPFIIMAITSLASLLVVEPATSRSAGVATRSQDGS